MGCVTCGKPLSGRGTTGYCRGCQTKAAFADPALRQWRVSIVTRASRQRLSWCPLEYQDEYRRLTRNCDLRANEARSIIERQISADAKAYARTGQLQQSGRRG